MWSYKHLNGKRESPFCSMFPGMEVFCQGKHRCPCPFHTHSHHRPSRCCTDWGRSYYNMSALTQCQTATLAFIWTSHHTADASISLHDALSVEVAWVALTVRTQPVEFSSLNRISRTKFAFRVVLAASYLISSETRLTVSTDEWTLKVACSIY